MEGGSLRTTGINRLTPQIKEESAETHYDVHVRDSHA
jgi:hypothetical protein